MVTDADAAARIFPAAGIMTSAPALLQGIARILSGDLDGADAALADAARRGEQIGTLDIVAEAQLGLIGGLNYRRSTPGIRQIKAGRGSGSSPGERRRTTLRPARPVSTASLRNWPTIAQG